VSRPFVPVEHVASQLRHAAVRVAKNQPLSWSFFLHYPLREQARQCLEPIADCRISLRILVVDPRFPVAKLIQIAERHEQRMDHLMQVRVDVGPDQLSVDRAVVECLQPAPLDRMQNPEQKPAPVPLVLRMDLQRLLENARRPIVDRNHLMILEVNANVRPVQLVHRPNALLEDPRAIGLDFRRDDVLALLIVHALERALDLGEVDDGWLVWLWCGGRHGEG